MSGRSRLWTLRVIGLLALGWLSGCARMCGGLVADTLESRAISGYTYASPELVWPQVVAVMASEGVTLPEAPPPVGEVLTVPQRDPSWGTYRVTLEGAGFRGSGVHLRIESVNRPTEQNPRPPVDRRPRLEREVLTRVDPAAIARINAQGDTAGQHAQSGCSLVIRGFEGGVSACDTVLGACDIGSAPAAPSAGSSAEAPSAP